MASRFHKVGSPYHCYFLGVGAIEKVKTWDVVELELELELGARFTDLKNFCKKNNID